MSDLQFGVFDHLDRVDGPIDAFFADRLALVERYDRLGFDRYHVAEHHATPLGMAPSPSVYLSSVAQRTRRLRFGPLVYLLPLYHPLRLAEEIAMLDALGGGRLDVGVGRGQTRKEIELYGSDPAEGQARFDEVLAILRQALGERRVDFHGTYYRFDDVPVVLEAIQRPHPPLWYGVSSADNAEHLAASGINAVTLMKPEPAAAIVRRYREAARRAERDDLRIGIARFIVVGATDAGALALAQRAYERWHLAFHTIYTRYGTTPVQGFRPTEYAQMMRDGLAVAGSAATVAEALEREVGASGANYLVGQFMFGDMTLAEATDSIERFNRDVAPVLRAAAGRLTPA